MAGLCEGGNEPSGSLKAICKVTCLMRLHNRLCDGVITLNEVYEVQMLFSAARTFVISTVSLFNMLYYSIVARNMSKLSLCLGMVLWLLSELMLVLYSCTTCLKEVSVEINFIHFLRSRLVPVVWQQWSEMEALIPSLAACEVRSVIKFFNAQSIAPIEIHRQLCQVYGPNIMSKQMVRRWCRQFSEGRQSVHDEERSERPSLINDDRVEVMRQCIMENRRFTITELSSHFPHISRSLLHEIVTKHLLFKKVCARTKFKQTLSVRKVMCTVFWDRKGILFIDFLPRGETMNADRYCETLRKLRRVIQNKRRGMLTAGVVLLHDNARPHTAQRTAAVLTEFGWELFDHPPYKPDLAPSDFHVFLHLKKFLSSGDRFGNDEELKTSVTRWFHSQAAEFYDRGMQKLIPRYNKCLNSDGGVHNLASHLEVRWCGTFQIRRWNGAAVLCLVRLQRRFQRIPNLTGPVASMTSRCNENKEQNCWKNRCCHGDCVSGYLCYASKILRNFRTAISFK
ncbi:hypothetical protein ANN_18895 [Periplaneta americana]|uniref:Gustatory receptor n=1 Tax=Periplaneta americana TaxID=6978 RepID=A0ABQ8SR32_PERAM|nr:hypothetical protein ANN_18895 [Periplaneta americana]